MFPTLTITDRSDRPPAFTKRVLPAKSPSRSMICEPRLVVTGADGRTRFELAHLFFRDDDLTSPLRTPRRCRRSSGHIHLTGQLPDFQMHSSGNSDVNDEPCL